MSEKSLEIGPVVATSMIVLGLAAVTWAVATNPHSERPKIEFKGNISTGAEAEAEANAEGVTDSEWEQALIEVEKVKTDGIVTDVSASTYVATVDAVKWNELPEDRQREIGRRLAIYCGRISGTEKYQVKIVDAAGETLGSYERD